MLLIKHIAKNEKKSCCLNLSTYETQFLFLDLFHATHRKRLSHFKNRNDLIRKADYAAAVAAKFLSLTQHKDLVVSALRCCRDILLSSGFRETTRHDLVSTVKKNEQHQDIVFVAGCQTEELLEARVESALQLLRTLKRAAQVVFVGDSPPRRNLKIPHEHARMKEMFFSMLDGNYGDKNYSDVKQYVTQSNILEEKSSKTTQQNIDLFFKHDLFREKIQRSLYLVSSTFHLLRLGRECTQYLNSFNKRNHFNIQYLVLNGADPINKPSKHVFEPIYLKLMLFDIYFNLFSSIYNKRGETQL